MLLSVGAVLRLVAMLGYRPAIWFPDSYTYVVTALRPRPDLVRPAGYSMFLRLLEPFHSFGLVVAVQHLLGLAVGVLVYAAVRRARGRGWAATAASAPVLLDAYQIELEHLLVSDTLFMFLVVAAVFTCLAPLTPRRTCAAGLLLAAATLTRTVGLPLIAVVAAWCLVRHWRAARRAGSGRGAGGGRAADAGRGAGSGRWTGAGRAAGSGRGAGAGRAADAGRGAGGGPGGGRRAGARLAGVLVVAALLPVAGYGAWFAATYHRFGIVGSNGVFLYARTMSFADCAAMRPPPDLAVLCDDTPPSLRPPSQEYIWAADAPLVALPGITFTAETDRLAGRFAFLALRSQPADYAASVLSELSRSFNWGRPVYPDQEIYDYYEFPASAPAPPGRYPAMAGAEFASRYERGPIGTRVVEPFAGWARAYQGAARLPGTVLLVLLIATPAVALSFAVASRRRAGGTDGSPGTTGGKDGNGDSDGASGGTGGSDGLDGLDGTGGGGGSDGTGGSDSASGSGGSDGTGGKSGGGGSEGAWTLPWATALSLLVIPAATAEFDYRYVLPAVPLACLAAALMTAGQKDGSGTRPPADSGNFRQRPN